MGGSNFRPTKVKCFEKFLESRDCNYKSTEASHDKWRCPDCIRSIIFRGAEKDIPAFHIHTLLKTMGVSKEEFYEWIDKNC
tara:strand:+ start:2201 stop:2443 length:243 start_codon:yes stop_codon:yes gene_type:complete